MENQCTSSDDEIKNKIMVAMTTMSVEIIIIEDNDDNK